MVVIAIDKHFTAVSITEAICTSCLLFTIIETQRGCILVSVVIGSYVYTTYTIHDLREKR